MSLLWLDVGYACGGIVCDDNGIIVDTAPIFSWWKGKHVKEILKWKRIKNYEHISERGG